MMDFLGERTINEMDVLEGFPRTQDRLLEEEDQQRMERFRNHKGGAECEAHRGFRSTTVREWTKFVKRMAGGVSSATALSEPDRSSLTWSLTSADQDNLGQSQGGSTRGWPGVAVPWSEGAFAQQELTCSRAAFAIGQT